MSSVICMVAPNGARRTRGEHPQIPLAANELANTAVAVANAGATAIHLHVRDSHGKHSLSCDRYKEAINAIRKQCAQELFLQVTTEAAGIYTVQQQIDLVYQLKPQGVSLSVREISRADTRDVSALDRWMRDAGVLPQWILYDVEDVKLYQQWVREGVLCGKAYPVLFVLGSYAKCIDAEAEMLEPFLQSMAMFSSWMVCAFGFREQEIMKSVVTNGGHMRVGFENNLLGPDRKPVKDNAALVASSVAMVTGQKKTMASCKQTRQLLTPDW